MAEHKPRFLLVKRGWYYGPDNSGYVGMKVDAGRYYEHEARPDDGVTAIHEDNAPRFAPDVTAGRRLEYINERIHGAIDTYFAALTNREHGGVAAGKCLDRICELMDRHWGG